MDGTAVKEIKRIVEDSARIVEVDGVNYTNGNFHILRHKDRAETLGFNNLSSLVPILKNEIGRDDFKKPLYIIVADHRDVVVVTSLDDDLDRDRLYGVMTEESDFRFGRYYGYEEFVIALRSKFTDTGDRESLLEYLKKISDVQGVEISDDGVSQSVTTSSSVRGALSVPPIQRLAPYRTFTEVDQPASEFLFRVRQGGEFALFEADGGAWKHEARRNITKFYEEAFKDEIANGSVFVLS